MRKNEKITKRPGLVLHQLKERIKELEALHNTSRLLQVRDLPIDFLMTEIITVLPGAWQYPEVTAARIKYGRRTYSSPKFRNTRWRQKVSFEINDKKSGSVEVCYLKKMPDEYQGPFLKEEFDLINSLAEMLKSFFERKEAEAALKSAYQNLESMVDERTTELEGLNRTLKSEIEEHKRDKERIRQYQQKLVELASELSLAEERERKTIASELHDQIGQSLAMLKLKLLGMEQVIRTADNKRDMKDVLQMLDRTIYHTRNLTVELSPPVLNELGLVPAIEWLGEQFNDKYNLNVQVHSAVSQVLLNEEMRYAVFRTVRELLVNAVKHSRAQKIRISLSRQGSFFRVSVRDNGTGFDPAKLKAASIRGSGFGLVSIRERLRCLGGGLKIKSAPGKGTMIEATVKIKTNREKNE